MVSITYAPGAKGGTGKPQRSGYYSALEYQRALNAYNAKRRVEVANKSRSAAPKPQATPMTAARRTTIANKSSIAAPKGKGIVAPKKPAAKPKSNYSGSGSGSAYSAITGGGMSDIPTPQPPNTTLDQWKVTDPNLLLREASQISESTYNPILENLRRQYGNLQSEQEMGRKDILLSQARQLADISALYDKLGLAGSANKLETAGMADTAIQKLGEQTGAAQQHMGTSGAAMMQMLQNQAEKMGVGETAMPGMQNVSRDTQFMQGLMENTNTANTAALQNSKLANAALADLTQSGIQSQGAMETQQRKYAADEALMALDQESLGKLGGLQTEEAGVKSKQVADMYELWNSLKATDWEKYMDTSTGLFGQMATNTELAQKNAAMQASAQQALYDAMAKASGGSGEDANRTAYENAQAYINSAVPEGSANKAQYDRVLNILQNPTKFGSDVVTPIGTAKAGQYNGPAFDKNRRNEYYARAYSILANNGVISSQQDPNWSIMVSAIDRMFGEAK